MKGKTQSGVSISLVKCRYTENYSVIYASTEVMSGSYVEALKAYNRCIKSKANGIRELRLAAKAA